MEAAGRDKALRIALMAVGLVYVFGLLGVFLLLASRAPAEHRSLIGFAVWSSLVHGLVMLAQALRDPMERANMYGDIPALILVGVALLVLNRTSPPRPVGQG